MSNCKRRALLSVYDKTGLESIARALAGWGVELVSTGGTAKAIKSFGLACTPIEAVTGFPELMDGRIKTLHPKVHGALLKVRGNSEHEAAASFQGIGEFDFVVVNLYPFRETAAKPGVKPEDVIENIDIGGPAMLRSGAKNFKWVTVMTDPADYGQVIASLSCDGRTSWRLRQALAAKVFAYTGAYDAAVGTWLKQQNYD